jgi:hypothetical protein
VAGLLCAGVILATTQASACFLESGLGGELSTSDPLTIPVLVAARKAAESGSLTSVDMRDRSRLSRIVATLGYVPMLLDGARVDANRTRFAVLQAQTGYWTRYTVAGGVVRTEPHLRGPGEVEAVLVIADAALIDVVLDGRSLEQLGNAGLVRARGEGAAQAVAAYTQLLDQFSNTSFAERLRALPPKI